MLSLTGARLPAKSHPSRYWRLQPSPPPWQKCRTIKQSQGKVRSILSRIHARNRHRPFNPGRYCAIESTCIADVTRSDRKLPVYRRTDLREGSSQPEGKSGENSTLLPCSTSDRSIFSPTVSLVLLSKMVDGKSAVLSPFPCSRASASEQWIRVDG